MMVTERCHLPQKSIRYCAVQLKDCRIPESNEVNELHGMTKEKCFRIVFSLKGQPSLTLLFPL